MSTVNVKLNVGGTDYLEVLRINIDKSMDDYNTTSSFTAEFSNYAGEYDDTFSLNDEVIIYADYDTTNPTTKIFKGIIESIKFNGSELNESLTISGRDYGAILQDIIVSPRTFKNIEASELVLALMTQNANGLGITYNNVNISSTTIDRLTFNNITLFDSIKQISEVAGFYFYIDEDKDLHFEERDSISSGETLNSTNIMSSHFDISDNDIFNNVYVYGNRQLTGVREIFGSSDFSNGSICILDDAPHNTIVMGSATIPSYIIQPGGVINLNDPATDNVKWLMDFNQKKIVLVSGTVAGDNTGWVGSGIVVDYQRSSLLVSIKQDLASQVAYGLKDKRIIDKNIRTIDEANERALSYLNEHKDPKTYGEVKTRGIISINPGNTVVVDIPFYNINTQTYSVIKSSYNFTKDTCLSDTFLSLSLNKKIRNFLDLMKEQELRLRAIEGSDTDTSISSITLGTGSITVVSSGCKVISRSIGSAFYFHVPNHDKLNSPTSVLGDARLGSIVK